MNPSRAIRAGALATVPFMMFGAGAAKAVCRFSPFAFFPDRNDAVEIAVATQPGAHCAMAFRAGPGYRFTSASMVSAPPHGVLAKTGKTAFLYIALNGYRGADRYGLKVCAIVNGRSGCSSLTYNVTVE